jgi:hypothetical protein
LLHEIPVGTRRVWPRQGTCGLHEGVLRHPSTRRTKLDGSCYVRHRS